MIMFVAHTPTVSRKKVLSLIVWKSRRKYFQNTGASRFEEQNTYILEKCDFELETIVFIAAEIILKSYQLPVVKVMNLCIIIFHQNR